GYEAFKRTEQWKRGQKINGLTPDQRYFLGYALSWLGQRRPEALQNQIMTDVHAPAFLRVNGPPANIPEVYAAFGIKPGDAMDRRDEGRVVIGCPLPPRPPGRAIPPAPASPRWGPAQRRASPPTPGRGSRCSPSGRSRCAWRAAAGASLRPRT